MLEGCGVVVSAFLVCCSYPSGYMDEDLEHILRLTQMRPNGFSLLRKRQEREDEEEDVLEEEWCRAAAWQAQA